MTPIDKLREALDRIEVSTENGGDPTYIIDEARAALDELERCAHSHGVAGCTACDAIYRTGFNAGRADERARSRCPAP